MSVIEGHLSSAGRRFGIAAARTNDLVVSRLLDGALDAFRRTGAAEADVVVVRSPGAWELPLALRDLGRAGGFDALVALGAVIRGGTPHFEYIAAETAKGVFQVSLCRSACSRATPSSRPSSARGRRPATRDSRRRWRP